MYQSSLENKFKRSWKLSRQYLFRIGDALSDICTVQQRLWGTLLCIGDSPGNLNCKGNICTVLDSLALSVLYWRHSRDIVLFWTVGHYLYCIGDTLGISVLYWRWSGIICTVLEIL
jgi:hypothetical protein